MQSETNYEFNNNVNFKEIGLDVPDIIQIYSYETQTHIYNYLMSLTTIQRKAYTIAINHLGTSFDIIKSVGFNKWCNDNKIIIKNN